MTVQKTLKLTALGLGMASIALTGCKGKDGGNGVDGKNGTTITDSKGDKVTTAKGKEIDKLKPFEDGAKTTVTSETDDGKGNKTRTEKTIDLAKGEFKVSLSAIPVNGCGDLHISYVDKDGTLIVDDIIPYYNPLMNHDNSPAANTNAPRDFQVTLTSDLQKDYIIKGREVCVINEEDSKNHTNVVNGFSNQKTISIKNSDGNIVTTKISRKTQRSEDRRKALIGKNKVTVQYRYGGLIGGKVTADVVDSIVNVIHIDHKDEIHLIPEGSNTAEFEIRSSPKDRLPEIADAVGNEIDDSNTSIQSTVILTKDDVEIAEVVDVMGNKLSLEYNDKTKKWSIKTEALKAHPEYKAYNLRILPKRDSTKQSVIETPLRIKVVPAIPVAFEIDGLHTNIHGKQGFNIIATYSNGKKLNIKELPQHERRLYHVEFDVEDISDYKNRSNVRSNFDIEPFASSVEKVSSENKVKRPSAVLSALKNRDYGVNKEEFYIDTKNVPHFNASTSNKLYELQAKITYTPELLEDDTKIEKYGFKLTVDQKSRIKALYSSDVVNDSKILKPEESRWVKRQFIVSEKSPQLFTQFKFFNATSKKYDVVKPNLTSPVGLPKGGVAFEDDFELRHLCVKAESVLKVGNTIVNGYRHIAELNIDSDPKKSNFIAYFDHKDTDDKNAHVKNIVCATPNAVESNELKLVSKFQDLTSKNELSVKVLKEVNIPRVTLAYIGTAKPFHHSFAKGDIKEFAPYYLTSIGTLGEKLEIFNDISYTVEYNQANLSPISLITTASPSVSQKLTYASTVDFDPAYSQYQTLKFSPSSITNWKRAFSSLTGTIESTSAATYFRNYFGDSAEVKLYGDSKLTGDVNLTSFNTNGIYDHSENEFNRFYENENSKVLVPQEKVNDYKNLIQQKKDKQKEYRDSITNLNNKKKALDIENLKIIMERTEKEHSDAVSNNAVDIPAKLSAKTKAKREYDDAVLQIVPFEEAVKTNKEHFETASKQLSDLENTFRDADHSDEESNT